MASPAISSLVDPPRLLPMETDDYSFASVYVGPPVPYDLPRAVPIDIDSIPIAAEASTSAADAGNLSIPVVEPLPYPPATSKRESKDASDPIASVSVVAAVAAAAVTSPTSVMEANTAMGRDGSGEVASSSCLDLRSRDLSDPAAFSSDLSSDFPFNSDEEDQAREDITPSSPRRHPVLVTFHDSEISSDFAASSFDRRETSISNSNIPRSKRGACYHCLKGTRFTEKETCLVCDAKYCRNCILRVMGSMPEGRKCVACIGAPIEESKRERLGKSSRILKRLLSLREVQQVMKAEKYCEANQLRAEDVCVNRKKLSPEEMVILQSCPNPPAKLKPGYYWYDKVSGFWGKEGHKPHMIISSNLNIGGPLMRNASNGDTGILINNREVTKKELQMLKWAGVQCAGNPHFWVNADGTYQEEGQKNIKGRIWSKPGIKLLCSMLSLPIPPKAETPSEEEINNVFNKPVYEYLEQRTLQKLLLIGYQGSGTSTLFKQAKFLYKTPPFSADEWERMKLAIQSNIYSYLAILLEGRERFEEESIAEKRKKHMGQSFDACATNELEQVSIVTEYSLNPRLKAFSDWVLKVTASGNLETIFPAATREYALTVEELWRDAAIQATYNRRRELDSFPCCATYFLERALEICKVEYEPSDMDILHAEGIILSNSLATTDFSFPQPPCDEREIDATEQQDRFLRYQLIRLHTRGFGENCKWLDMFEDVRIVIFCVAISDYDEFYEDENGVVLNKMMESKKLFENIVRHPTFDQINVLLVLNKFDDLEKKIDSSPLTVCEWFRDFNPVTSSQPTNSSNNSSSMAQFAFYFVASTFKKLFYSLTGEKLFVTKANGLDRESVDGVLKYAREILKWEDEKVEIMSGCHDFSAYSNEQSSYSH